MIQKKIVEGDLLYHAVHGLCRVDEIIKQSHSGKNVLCYSLVPKVVAKMKTRFVIPVETLEASGFHLLISVEEANAILKYLKEENLQAVPSGNGSAAAASSWEQSQTWSLAREILTFSHDKIEARDQRKRQILERSMRGLVGELAFVFKITLKETVAKVQKSLGRASKINPSVMVALEHAGED